jgi:hypothetical protein
MLSCQIVIKQTDETNRFHKLALTAQEGVAVELEFT